MSRAWLIVLLCVSKSFAWRSTSIIFNEYQYDYPITPFEMRSDSVIQTKTDTMQSTPVKLIKNDKLKQRLIKRGYNWIAEAMP